LRGEAGRSAKGDGLKKRFGRKGDGESGAERSHVAKGRSEKTGGRKGFFEIDGPGGQRRKGDVKGKN